MRERMLVICPTSQANCVRHVGTTGKSVDPKNSVSTNLSFIAGGNVMFEATKEGMLKFTDETLKTFGTFYEAGFFLLSVNALALASRIFGFASNESHGSLLNSAGIVVAALCLGCLLTSQYGLKKTLQKMSALDETDPEAPVAAEKAAVALNSSLVFFYVAVFFGAVSAIAFVAPIGIPFGQAIYLWLTT
jgi:hypothetical protein